MRTGGRVNILSDILISRHGIKLEFVAVILLWNDDNWWHHWLCYLAGVCFTDQKPFFFGFSKCFHQSNSFVKETYFGKFQGHNISLSGKTKGILNFKNILHFKTTSTSSVKLIKFQMSQLFICRIRRVWFFPENVTKELNTIGGSEDIK